MSEHSDASKDVPASLSRTHGAEPAAFEALSAGVAAWQRIYRRGVIIADLAVLAGAVLVAQIARFGIDSGKEAVGPISVSYTQLGFALAIMWWLTLLAFRAHDVRILGEAFTEYRLITRSTVLMFGSFAIGSLMLKWDMSRGFLAIALPLGLAGLLLERKLWRVWLRRHRRGGRFVSGALIIGGQQAAREIAAAFARDPDAGLRVTGVWVPDAETLSDDQLRVPHGFIPVLGKTTTLNEAMKVADASTIERNDTKHIGHHGLREQTSSSPAWTWSSWCHRT